MKLLLIFGAILIMLSAIQAQFTPKQEPKRYKVEMTLPEWDTKLNQIEVVKTQIRQSDIPSKNAVYMLDSILTPLQQLINYQVSMQLRAESNSKSIQPQGKDSTAKPEKQ